MGSETGLVRDLSEAMAGDTEHRGSESRKERARDPLEEMLVRFQVLFRVFYCESRHIDNHAKRPVLPACMMVQEHLVTLLPLITMRI